MYINKIYDADLQNGKGVGVTLCTSGCNQRCPGCFNSEAWNFFFGVKYTSAHEQQILDMMGKEYIDHLAIIGGEPLTREKVIELSSLIQRVKQCYPDKKIWVWSGYTWPQIYATAYDMTGTSEETPYDIWTIEEKRTLQTILETIDILVDGPFIQEQRDITLKWRGSKNQQVLDIKQTLLLPKSKIVTEPVLYCD